MFLPDGAATVTPTRVGDESLLRLLYDQRTATRRDAAEIERRQRTRLADLVAFARARSPYYRRLYRGVPAGVTDAAVLPVVGKKELMANFDGWVTDGGITLARTQAFLADPACVGERLLDRYLVSLTAGTSGEQGIVLADGRARAVTAALSVRTLRTGLSTADLARIAIRGGRIAVLVATHGHTTGHAYLAGMRKSSRLLGRVLGVFGVHEPLPELVARLNAFRPAVLSGYASVVALLAREQDAGRLRIRPQIVQPTSEGLAEAEYLRIAAAFGARVHLAYSATECGFMTAGCTRGSLHVNDDWVVLEAVDAAYRPVPDGIASHTVLLSNLANRVQPILRYDLGDSIVRQPTPCPCGSPLPAIRVIDRAANDLTFPDRAGTDVMIPSLAIITSCDHLPGVERFQVVQTSPTVLRVRLRPAAGADPEETWRAAEAGITRVLAEHRLGHVAVERATEPPQPDPGGKYRWVIPLSRSAGDP
jgi:phenylacetate-coenzyme A ligase PaaK-like adenylate-forming protein